MLSFLVEPHSHVKMTFVSELDDSFYFADYPFFCAGFDEGAHQGGISLFETQVHTPTIHKVVLDEPPR